tara:strand:+ start:841 stop:1056 length:216 start_codon:yes stop_codon:yes gene_type:complete
MKKLLLVLIALTSTSILKAEITMIDEKSNIRVHCISGYVFVRVTTTSLTQLMLWDEDNKVSRPMKCSEYKK